MCQITEPWLSKLMFWTTSVSWEALHLNRHIFLFCFLFVCFCFWPRCVSFGVLVPQPGIEPWPSAVKALSPNHWPAREFPVFKWILALDFWLCESNKLLLQGLCLCEVRSVICTSHALFQILSPWSPRLTLRGYISLSYNDSFSLGWGR